MKRRLLPSFVIAAIISAGVVSCSKDDTPSSNNNQDIQKVETAVLNDFVQKLANPLYKDFADRSNVLFEKVQALTATPSTEAQTAAQDAWKSVRELWEQSEGFLIGPVDDNEYDPHLDSWPTDHNEIENILTTQPNITAEGLKSVDDFVRGFHPLEYLLWDKNPSTYSDAEKNYMNALAEYIKNNVEELQASWLGENGYGNILSNPGAGNEVFETKSEALQLIAEALVGICDEVGNGKMVEPFTPTPDSTISESPYSHNSVTDFKNNILGAYQSYTCSYNGAAGASSLSTLVQINNKQLDSKIKSAFQNAISSFDGFKNNTFEYSIYKEQSTVQNVIDQIQALNNLLQTELVNYIKQYVKD